MWFFSLRRGRAFYLIKTTTANAGSVESTDPAPGKGRKRALGKKLCAAVPSAGRGHDNVRTKGRVSIGF